MAASQHIVVIGGGFAGTALVKRLEKLLGAEHRITLVSQENYTTFNPMLAEVVGASVFPVQIIAPIRQMLKRARFIMAKVSNIDLQRKTVSCACEGAPHEIAYDHLVLAFGSRANLAFISGMEQHGLPFKLIGDAMHIRNRVLERLEQAQIEPDPERRRWLTQFVVVGGGFSGVEIAGELTDIIHKLGRHYDNIATKDLQVTLLQDGERLLPEMPDALGRHASHCMSHRCVHFRLNARATKVDERGVTLQSGERVDAATVICTIGTKPNPLVEPLAVPKERGRILTLPDMAVKDTPGLWALGDCALIVNALEGKFAPPTAQFAVQEALQLAANIARTIAGKPTQPFSHKPRGSLATIGHLNGVANIGKIRLHGLPAWFLWRAFYLSQMPTFTRKIRIFVEWTWGMFFATETTHLRFTRTHEADAAQPQPAKQAA